MDLESGRFWQAENAAEVGASDNASTANAIHANSVDEESGGAVLVASGGA